MKFSSDSPEKVKIAATRIGFNKPPDNINPDSSDKNLDIGAVIEYKNSNLKRTADAFRLAGEQGTDLVVSSKIIL